MIDLVATEAVAPRRIHRRGYVRKAHPVTCAIDRRSRRSRRFEFLVKSFTPGDAPLSEADKAQIALAASLTLAVEEMQLKLLKGESIDGGESIRLANSQRRALLAVAEISRRTVTRKTLRETLLEEANDAESREQEALERKRHAQRERQRRYRSRRMAKAAEALAEPKAEPCP